MNRPVTVPLRQTRGNRIEPRVEIRTHDGAIKKEMSFVKRKMQNKIGGFHGENEESSAKMAARSSDGGH